LSDSEKTFSSRVGGEDGSKRSGNVKAKSGNRQAREVKIIPTMKAAMVRRLIGIQSNGGGSVIAIVVVVDVDVDVDVMSRK
jgi:hypothetical protein